MIINRHNYEEFFLLYVDEELGAEEQLAVEAFVSQNPDLAKELEVLKQITLGGENVEFANKELLYRSESGITLSNYEEYFTLFLDKELSEKKAAEVEGFVLRHPQLQDEFTLLQRIKLQPEPILFTGKLKLYRREETYRRIILLRFAKWSAAAVIAGALYMSFVLYNNDNKSSFETVTQVPASPGKEVFAKKDTSMISKSLVKKAETELPEIERKNDIEKATARNIGTEKRSSKQPQKVRKAEESVAKADITEPQKETAVEEKNLASVEKVDPQPQVEEKEPITEFHDNSNFNTAKQESKEDVFLDKPIAAQEKALVTHAVYLETDEVEQEKTLYIGSARINKNKVKGLFKKAANFLDKQLLGGEN